jgi:hypothetical protein
MSKNRVVMIKLAAAAGTMLYLWNFEEDKLPQVILQTKVSLRCVRFLDNKRLLVGVRSRTNSTGITNYIRAARAQLLLYEYKEVSHTHTLYVYLIKLFESESHTLSLSLLHKKKKHNNVHVINEIKNKHESFFFFCNMVKC